MYSYPYDPTGKAASNRFREEHIVSSDEKNLRVIRLQHAPFFRPLTDHLRELRFPIDRRG